MNGKKIPLLELKESTKTNNIIKEKEKENYDKKEYQNKQFSHKVTLNDFKILKTLGKGAFGKVLLVYNEELNKYFAMKILKKDFIKKNKQIVHTKVERKILEKIDYPFIAQLFSAFSFPNISISTICSDVFSAFSFPNNSISTICSKLFSSLSFPIISNSSNWPIDRKSVV